MSTQSEPLRDTCDASARTDLDLADVRRRLSQVDLHRVDGQLGRMVRLLFLHGVRALLRTTLSDRIGRKPLLIFFGVAETLATAPLLFTLQSVKSPLAAFLLICAAWTMRDTQHQSAMHRHV